MSILRNLREKCLIVVFVYVCITNLSEGKFDASSVKSRRVCYLIFDKLMEKTKSTERRIKLVQSQFKICDLDPDKIRHALARNFISNHSKNSKPNSTQLTKISPKWSSENHPVKLQLGEKESSTPENAMSERESKHKLLPREATIVFLLIFVPIFFSAFIVAMAHFIYIFGATNHKKEKSHDFPSVGTGAKDSLIQHIHLHLNKHKSEQHSEEDSDPQLEKYQGQAEKMQELKNFKGRNIASTKNATLLGRFKKDIKTKSGITKSTRKESKVNKAKPGKGRTSEIAAETIGVVAESLHLAGYKILLANVLMRIFEEEVLRGNAGGGGGDGEKDSVVKLLNNLNSTVGYEIPDLKTWNSSSAANSTWTSSVLHEISGLVRDKSTNSTYPFGLK